MKSTFKENILSYNWSKNEKYFLFYLIITSSLYLFFLLDQTPVYLPIVFFVTLAISLPIGFAALLPFKNSFQAPTSIKIILYISIGLSANFLWSFILSPYMINPLASFSLYVLSIFIIFFNFYKFYSKNKIIKTEKIQENFGTYNQLTQSQIFDYSKFNIKKC